jgi:ABC-type amino acid transport substrate-binding protein
MRALLLALLALFTSCSSREQSRHGTYRIGVDASWSPLNFDTQQPYVNGYTEDLLLEISRYNGISFEKISATFDTLQDGLTKGKYDAILSSMPPLIFNTAKYDFSQNFLNTGLVLVTSANAKYDNLKDLSNELVGIIAGSPAAIVLEQNPKIIIRTYPSIATLFTGIMNGEIEAAVVDRLPAAAYVRDLYNEKLKIVNTLTSSGLHAIAKKDSGHLIHMFNQAIEHMKKKKTLNSLEKKWQLE